MNCNKKKKDVQISMIKKWLSFVTIVAVLTGIILPDSVLADSVTRIYVSQNGNDNNSGTVDAPFKTIEKAQSVARNIIADGMKENIEVVIGEGTYIFDKTWEFDERDSGNNGFSVKYIGENYPLISGGRKIEGFESIGNGMWKAYAPEFDFIRELYVNDVRRYRASGEKEVVGVGDYDDSKTAKTVDGFYFDKNVLPVYERADDITMRSGVGWKGHEWGVKKIFADPENEDRTIAVMDNYFYSQVTIPHWGHAARYDIGFRIENAFELLDNPGEFYFNKDTKELFYIPKDGEDMNTAEVYAPVLETLLKVEGNCSEGKYIENLSFDGLRFAHTTLYFPEIMGYAPGQASTLHLSDRIQLNGNEGDVYSALHFATVRNCGVENCVIFGAGGIGVRSPHGDEPMCG